MNLYEDFLERLQQAVKKTGNMNRFAESIGVQPNLITRWLKQERVPSLTTIQPVANRLGLRFTTTYEMSASTTQHPSAATEKPSPPKKIEEEGMNISLDVYTVTSGDLRTGKTAQQPQFTLTAPPACFHQADLAIMMDGHSMLPTIPDKALVGVRKNAPFKANELFVAQIPYEGLVVKRVGADPRTEEFIFKSDNPNKDQYPDRRLPAAQAEKWIVGRVVWVMHAC